VTVQWRERVRPDWVDYNGHLSEAYYVLVFGRATDAVMDAIGLDESYRERTDASLFTVEAHVRYLAQVTEGELVEVASSIIGVGKKALRIWHEMSCEGTVRASEEILALHVDTTSERSVPFPIDVAGAAEALRVAPPDGAGRQISLTP
jgi:acyl-CoA thioester hydrolase